MTVQDICNNALKRIGALAAGETPAFDLLNDAFLRLNTLIDLLATQQLTINGLEKFSLAGIVGHNPYTIGPGGDFNQARPIWVPIVTITLPGTNPADLPVALVDVSTYAQRITTKTVQSQVPQIAYYDQASPKGNLNLFPILNDHTVLLNIWVPVALVQFTSLAQSLTLLPGFQAMLEYNLAEDLLPEWGRGDQATAGLIIKKAAETLGWIKRANLSPSFLVADPGLLGRNSSAGIGDWWSGP